MTTLIQVGGRHYCCYGAYADLDHDPACPYGSSSTTDTDSIPATVRVTFPTSVGGPAKTTVPATGEAEYAAGGIVTGAYGVGDGLTSNTVTANSITALAPYAAGAAALVPITHPDVWVAIKDGRIICTHDEPFTHEGVKAVRYRHTP